MNLRVVISAMGSCKYVLPRDNRSPTLMDPVCVIVKISD